MYLFVCWPGRLGRFDRRRKRQDDRKLASLAGRALDGNLSSMRLNDVLHQRQPQAAAFVLMAERIADPIKLVEDLVLLGARDADAIVGYIQPHRSVGSIKAHG